jgi:hypothetical protein
MLDLLHGEELFTENGFSSVMLTNKRIIASNKNSKHNFQCKSIVLQNITSCRIVATDNIWYLVFGLLIAVASLFYLFFIEYSQPPAGVMGTIAGAFFVVGYFFTRKKVVSVASPTCTIQIDTSDVPTDQVLYFVNLVQYAQLESISEQNSSLVAR